MLMQKARKYLENGDRSKNLPHFEQLEPRIMLSADSLNSVRHKDCVVFIVGELRKNLFSNCLF